MIYVRKQTDDSPADLEILKALADRLAAWEVSGQTHADFAKNLLGFFRGLAPEIVRLPVDDFERVLRNLAAMPPKPHAVSKPVPGRKRGRPAKSDG